MLARRDGQLVWHPNSALRMQPLVNLSRSNNRWEAYTWLVDLDTPDEVGRGRGGREQRCTSNSCDVCVCVCAHEHE